MSLENTENRVDENYRIYLEKEKNVREIKFRGKSLVNIGSIKKGDWVYGGIVYDSDRVWIDVAYFGQIIVDKETVGQYTGLHDKNGKEIYEGDIIKYKTIVDGEFIKEVIFYEGTFCIDECEDYKPLLNELNYCVEVISNTHENEELLEG